MNVNSPAGHVNPASFSASIKSIVTNSVQIELSKVRSQPLRSTAIRSINYQVADFFGRCFLGFCYWVEVFFSLTRRDESEHYTALPEPPDRSPLHPATASISDFVSQQASSTVTGSSDVGEA